MRIALLGLLLLASTARAGSITLSIPDAKDQVVIDAVALYNARTGQALTPKQWAAAVLRAAVVEELAREKQREVDAAVEAARADLEALEELEAAKVGAAIAGQGGETDWGLPPTPTPTPVATPTVPMEPTPAVGSATP